MEEQQFKWTTVIDGVAMISYLLLILVIFICPIFYSIKIHSFSSTVFKTIAGTKPKILSLLILIFGYIFVIFTIVLFILFKKTTFFQHIISNISLIIDIIFALLTISFTCSLLGPITPSKCDKYENRLIYSLFSENITQAFIDWRQEARCIYDVECQVSAHQYMKSNCRDMFTANLIFTCLQIALLFIGLFFTITSFVLNPFSEEEEQNDEMQSENQA